MVKTRDEISILSLIVEQFSIDNSMCAFYANATKLNSAISLKTNSHFAWRKKKIKTFSLQQSSKIRLHSKSTSSSSSPTQTLNLNSIFLPVHFRQPIYVLCQRKKIIYFGIFTCEMNILHLAF